MFERNDTVCPFCTIPPHRIELENSTAIAFADAFPVAIGHMLIVPRRHVANIFELTTEELKCVFELVSQTKLEIDEAHHPHGFNIGMNVGRNAGQTIMHAHVHLIPRYLGDVADPTGGVRNIIPGKGPY